MDDQVFADGIGQISVIAGTVRVDFVAYSPVEKDARGQPVAVFRHRLIMSIESFFQTAEKIQEAAQALSSRVSQPPKPEPHEAVIEPIIVQERAPAQAEAPKPAVKPPFP